MPSYMTDFTEGTKAAYEAQMIPLRAQAEADKIPLQKELDVQKVQQGRVEAETAKINLQNLMRTTAEDADSREIMQNFYKDPANRALPLDDQTKKIGQLLAGKGQFEKSLKWFDESSKATERDAKAAETRSKTEDRQMEHIRSWISDLSPDNVGQKIMILQQSKEIPPQMAAGIRQHLDQARGDPEAFAAVKKQMMDVYQSMAGRQQREKEYQNSETIRVAEKKIDETAKHNRNLESGAIRVQTRLAEQNQITQALNQDKNLTAQLRELDSAGRVIVDARAADERKRKALAKEQELETALTPSRFGGSNAAYDAQEKRKTERNLEIAAIKDRDIKSKISEKAYEDNRKKIISARERLQDSLPKEYRSPLSPRPVTTETAPVSVAVVPAPQKIRSIEDFTKETNANKNLTKEQKQDQIDRYTRGFNNIKTEEKVTAPPPPGGAIPDAKK